MGVKIDQKSIKKGAQNGKASWHRFLSDFGGFWEVLGGEATAGRAPGRAPETHYIEMSLSFPFELEIRQNVS